MEKDTNYTFDNVRVVMVNTTEPGKILVQLPAQ